MGVYIKGMKMPKMCLWCPFQYVGSCRGGVKANVNFDLGGRPDDCPLVEVQEPHGDLIDRDVVVKEMINGIRAGNCEEGYEMYPNINNLDDCVECVRYADAVIEAEGK